MKNQDTKGTDEQKLPRIMKYQDTKGQTNKSDKECEKLGCLGDRRTKVTRIVKNQDTKGTGEQK